MHKEALNTGRSDRRGATLVERAFPSLRPLPLSSRALRQPGPFLRFVSAVVGVIVLSGAAWGQSRATIVNDPGSNVTVSMAFVANTQLFGPISGLDSDTVGVQGSALVTLFPSEPPFRYCTVHSMSLTIDTVSLSYRFLIFFTMDGTLSDLRITSTAPFFGVIDEAGNVAFAETPLRITGSARIVSEALTLDETMAVDADSVAPLAIHMSVDGGIVSWDQMFIPSTLWTVPVELLPEGILSLDIGVEVDTSGVALRGPYGPALLGDTDADDDVDLGDLGALNFCLSGPDTPAIPFCGVLMFDDDDDVDLIDIAEFQNAFTGPS